MPANESFPKKKVNVFIVSDATGITAERVINAVLVQFKQIQPIFKKFSFVKTKTQIKDILIKAKADIIILGIFRTSKTPTSFYLSCNHGMKVANIPIIKDVPLPEIIFTLKKRKFGFTISPKKVAIIRQKRLLYTGESDYADIDYIKEEVFYSHKIFRKIKGLQVIDVTNSSIEEVAEKII